MSARQIPGVGCVPTHTDSRFLGAVHIYLMGVDLNIFALTIWKIDVCSLTSQTKISMALFRDGLLTLVNAITLTLEFLDLSDLVNGISGIPNAVALTIVATRAVRNLHVEANGFDETSDVGVSPRLGGNESMSEIQFAHYPAGTSGTVGNSTTISKIT
ncbi:hypothetical protein K474DRAFT_178837 [Panus rudis PR-1116 ss-1]|nr:hypothetical protein K474DRAFT_178837 [Panus rudis PR-1116 ss-1]